MSHPHTPNRRRRASENLHIRQPNKPTTHNRGEPTIAAYMLATTSHKSNTTPHHQSEATTSPIPGFPHSGRRDSGPVVSKPNSVSGNPSPQNPTEAESRCGSTFVVHQTRRHYSTRVPHGSHPHQLGMSLVVLLRKEVIQPHLPVRLPCYDFVPIADPTFDGSLPHGVRPPASGVTDFHDVTGGVYKARERIHRSVADLRLLATPTSRGRVADPDPN